MKLTKEALKQIIKEELESMAEATIVNPLPKSSRKSTLPPIGGGGYRSPTKLPKQSDMPELIGSIAGKDIPNEAKYPELLGGIKKLLDGAFGKNYSLFRELKAMAEYYAKNK